MGRSQRRVLRAEDVGVTTVRRLYRVFQGEFAGLRENASLVKLVLRYNQTYQKRFFYFVK